MHLSKGKGKSKGKKTISLTRATISKEPQRQSKRWTSSNSKKCITLRYFDAKINFTLKNVQESLAELLKEVFTNLPELQNYSVLSLLKLPDKKQEQESYSHQIDTKQAMTLLYHLQGIRNGRVNEMQQIEELIKIIQTYQLNDNEIGSSLREEFYGQRVAFNNEVVSCRKALKALHQKKVEEIQNIFSESHDAFRLNILESKIEQLSLKLFDETVIGLRQFQMQKKTVVEVIFEHSYPSKIYSKTFLMRRIGGDMYLKKKMSFINVYAVSQREGLNNTNLIVCHLCKKLIKREYVRCAQKDTKIIYRTHQNSPYVYYRRMIAVDYRYDPTDAPDLHQELDYFKYAYHPNKPPSKECNRINCIECIPKLRRIESKDYFMNYKCDFCCQICACESCTTAYEIVRTLAHFYHVLVRNRQNKQPYQRIINRVNFIEKKDPHFKINTQCRTGFKETGNFDFKLSYETIMAKYERLAQKMKEVQDLTVASEKELSDPSKLLTPQLREVKKMFEQLKKIRAHKQNRGKTLQDVLLLNKEIQQKRIQKLQDEAIGGKQKQTLKEKFDKQPEAHNIFRKFSVSNKQPQEIPFQTIRKEQADQITQQLLQKYPGVSQENVGRVIHIKNEVAYTEQDYDRMVVADKYRIFSQRQKTIDHLISEGVMNELAPENYLNYFEDINDYFPKKRGKDQMQEEINFVIESNESESEQEQEEGIQDESQRQVSIHNKGLEIQQVNIESSNPLVRNSITHDRPGVMKKEDIVIEVISEESANNAATFQCHQQNSVQSDEVQNQDSDSVIEEITWKEFNKGQRHKNK